MSKELKLIGLYFLRLWIDDLLFVFGQLPISSESNELEKGFKNQCTRPLSNIQLILKNERLMLKGVTKIMVLIK